MKITLLDQFKEKWKDETAFSEHSMSQEDFEIYLRGRSKSLDTLFRKNLILDIVLKSMLSASFIILAVLQAGKQSTLPLILLAVCLAGIVYQQYRLRESRVLFKANDDLRHTLEKKIEWFRQKFVPSLIIGAFSNSLLFISGSMFYIYFKYGTNRIVTLDDFIVAFVFILLAFGLGFFSQLKLFNDHIINLEKLLADLNDNNAKVFDLSKERKQKLVRSLLYSLLLLIGILVLLYFILVLN